VHAACIHGRVAVITEDLIDDDVVGERKREQATALFFNILSQAPGSWSDYPMPLVSALGVLAWWTGYVPITLPPFSIHPGVLLAGYYTWCEEQSVCQARGCVSGVIVRWVWCAKYVRWVGRVECGIRGARAGV